jgi:hypothetical protein
LIFQNYSCLNLENVAGFQSLMLALKVPEIFMAWIGVIFTPHASVPDPYAQGMRNVPDTYAQHVLKGLRSVHGLVLDANA